MFNNRIHGFLDYVTVGAFSAIPTLFGLTGVPATLSYALAAIHLTMTVLTDFEMGFVKVLPLRIHKAVEMIVGPLLMVCPWLLGFSANQTARWVYVGAGIVINVVGWLSSYSSIRV